jgi:type IV secretion system protein VirD4
VGCRRFRPGGGRPGERMVGLSPGRWIGWAASRRARARGRWGPVGFRGAVRVTTRPGGPDLVIFAPWWSGRRRRAGSLSDVARRRLLAGDAGHSVLVVGPTQSFKTTGLAVPALLEWRGPVLAASVKGDLVRDTVAWRRQQGTAWIYDPTASTYRGHRPLVASDAAVVTWSSARRVADGLVEAGRTTPGALSDGDFWYATAAKLLAPLLLAAACSGRTMADVVRWIDEQEIGRGRRRAGHRRPVAGPPGAAGHLGSRRASTKRRLHHG